ncbi:MAG TPA: glutamate-cysteine ligase family protein [Planctomycetota bacterium]|nr:glutamate-cysteine ligase family protein [Planctomycetota bacterium]
MTLGLFAGYGIELEYMVVGAGDFAVRPIVDQLFRQQAGSYVGDWEDGDIAWSNELARHVVELKTNGPRASLHGVARSFAGSIARVDALLRGMGARLLPGGMHPTMRPDREFQSWPHGEADIYRAYDRIFDCRGHGWSNLQSCHLNLPFADDAEFGRLHLAVRALLPLLPALAASSPFCEGRWSGWLDWRLEVYRHNQDRVPAVTGMVVPEPVTTRQQYHDAVLAPMWAAIAPLDSDGLLQHEWLNWRGAVAKFARDAIEIRVLDVQESPFADLAICALVVAVLQAMTAERWCSMAALAALPTAELAAVLLAVGKDGDQTMITHRGLLAALGQPGDGALARDLWRRLAEQVLPAAGLDPELVRPLHTILERGPLARRMLAAVGPAPDASTLRGLCARLADCLLPGGDPVFGG